MKYQYFFRYIFYFFFIFYSNSALSIDNLNDKVKKLTLELRCMTCQNQSVYDSDSDFAKDITTLVED